MEPGHEDREYVATRMRADVSQAPQWSPVMKTGNTCHGRLAELAIIRASMEPGHEDREYPTFEPTHSLALQCLNGARS